MLHFWVKLYSGKVYGSMGKKLDAMPQPIQKQELTTHPNPSDMSNGEGGIRTRGGGLYPHDGLANRCLKPLGHLSESFRKQWPKASLL